MTLGVTSKPRPLQPTASPGIESNLGVQFGSAVKLSLYLLHPSNSTVYCKGFLCLESRPYFLGLVMLELFIQGLIYLVVPSAQGSAHVKNRPVVKAFSVLFNPVILIRNTPACGCDNAVQLTRSSEVFFVSQHLV